MSSHRDPWVGLPGPSGPDPLQETCHTDEPFLGLTAALRGKRGLQQLSEAAPRYGLARRNTASTMAVSPAEGP